MNEINPYESPASADTLTADERYQPRIFSISGRIGRVRYIAYSFFYNIIFTFLAGMIAGVVGAAFSPDLSGGVGVGMSIVLGIFYLVALAPYVILTRRRLHDLNRSGWYTVLIIVPLVNLLFTIYVVFFPGTDGPNAYGPAPVKNSLLIVVVLILAVVAFVGIIAAVAIPAYHEYLQRAEEVMQSTAP